jgi:sporulation protein YlmC with PRC-barrel domain
MFRSIQQLYGNKLGASDGEIGHVKDFYFDDQNWAIRYLVADTGNWLPRRQVLLSPHSLGRLDQAEKVLRVKLTRKQIEDSPPIESHKPVSRQYEEEFYRYYGWPYYWQGDALWGLSGFPILELPPTPLPSQSRTTIGPQLEPTDAHLRSTQTVNGYNVRTSDDVTVGHVCDFMMDTESWAVRQLVVKTGHRLSGNEALIQTKTVDRISYDESTLFVRLSAEAVEQGFKHSVPSAAAMS